MSMERSGSAALKLKYCSFFRDSYLEWNQHSVCMCYLEIKLFDTCVIMRIFIPDIHD